MSLDELDRPGLNMKVADEMRAGAEHIGAVIVELKQSQDTTLESADRVEAIEQASTKTFFLHIRD